jgi:hypothetical protein
MVSQSCRLGTLEATFCVYSDTCGRPWHRCTNTSGEDRYSKKAPQLRRELLGGLIKTTPYTPLTQLIPTQLIMRTAYVYLLLVKFTDGVLMMVYGNDESMTRAKLK